MSATMRVELTNNLFVAKVVRDLVDRIVTKVKGYYNIIYLNISAFSADF